MGNKLLVTLLVIVVSIANIGCSNSSEGVTEQNIESNEDIETLHSGDIDEAYEELELTMSENNETLNNKIEQSETSSSNSDESNNLSAQDENTATKLDYSGISQLITLTKSDLQNIIETDLTNILNLTDNGTDSVAITIDKFNPDITEEDYTETLSINEDHTIMSFEKYVMYLSDNKVYLYMNDNDNWYKISDQELDSKFIGLKWKDILNEDLVTVKGNDLQLASETEYILGKYYYKLVYDEYTFYVEQSTNHLEIIHNNNTNNYLIVSYSESQGIKQFIDTVIENKEFQSINSNDIDLSDIDLSDIDLSKE
jgi:hypothetical protein